MKVTPENREQLISDYTDRVLADMSLKDLQQIVGDQIEESFISYTHGEVEEQISRLYPDLLENL